MAKIAKHVLTSVTSRREPTEPYRTRGVSVSGRAVLARPEPRPRGGPASAPGPASEGAKATAYRVTPDKVHGPVLGSGRVGPPRDAKLELSLKGAGRPGPARVGGAKRRPPAAVAPLAGIKGRAAGAGMSHLSCAGTSKSGSCGRSRRGTRFGSTCGWFRTGGRWSLRSGFRRCSCVRRYLPRFWGGNRSWSGACAGRGKTTGPR